MSDENYICAKKAYSDMSASDLDEAGLPHVFDLLTTQQKQFFMNFFELAQKDFRESYDLDVHFEFLSNVSNELGHTGSDVVEDIMDRMGVKICKY
jgi:uncharacterized protein YciU (UPF0263 family)